MNSTLIKNEFKSSIKPFIICSITIILFIVIAILSYPLYEKNIMNISKWPHIILKILSLESKNTIDSFYGVVVEYSLILGAIMAFFLAFKAILWDTKNGYNIYLFTKPIERKKIFINKIIAIIFELVLFNILFNIISIILLKIISNSTNSIINIILINSALLLSQITFAALAMMFSSFIKKPKHIYPIAILIIFIFLLVSIIENIINISVLRYINPFSYFKVSDIVLYGKYKLSFIIASLFIIVFSISISYREYETLEI